MRKVFLKVIFIICFAFSGIGLAVVSPHAEEIVEKVDVVPGEEYVYYKVLIGDVMYIFVFTIDGQFVEVYPESCGGSHHGGH